MQCKSSKSTRRASNLIVVEHRTGSGTTVTVREGRINDRCAGVRPQTFCSSSGLRGWFGAHDDEIDRRLERAERRERMAAISGRNAQQKGGR